MTGHNYVLGGGVAGLVFATTNPEFTIIDINPLGQFNNQYQLGPRILQYSSTLNQFIEIVTDEKTIMSEAKIGYVLGTGITSDTATKEFIEKYSKITHGTSKVEDSFMSDGKNSIKHITFIRYGEESYNWLLKHLMNKIDNEKRIKYVKVDHINTETKELALGNGEVLEYNNLVNTIPLPIFQNLIVNKKISFDLETKKKHFYITEYNDENRKLSELYNYMYSVNGYYTRKTFYNDYIVYETIEPLREEHITTSGQMILKKYENLPIQIINSLIIDKIDGIHMLGRYAQWNHNIKINEVIERSLKLKGIING